MTRWRLEYCFKCGNATGRAGRGEDSLYDDTDDSGPYCEECWPEREAQKEAELNAVDDRLREEKRLLED